MKRVALYFLPLLFVLTYFVVDDGYLDIREHPEALRRDEITYMTYATNLLQGRFAPAGSEFLWAGPGYPLVLVPFVALDAPPLAAKLLNAIFLYCAVLLLYRALVLYLAPRRAFWGAAAFALYWPAYDEVGFLMTEPLAILLVAAILNYGCRYLRDGRLAHLALLAVGLAGLALTKVVFGYALAACMVIAVVVGSVRRRRVWWRAGLALALGLGLCSPYLMYTHQLTGKPFYWGTAGGMQLYWMSSPHEHEYGDWVNYVLHGKSDPTDDNIVMRNHGAVFSRALGYQGNFEDEPYDEMILRLGVRQDEILFAAARENIAGHPIKYGRNWLANVSRLLFGVPRSYTPETPKFLRYLFPNLLLLCCLAAAVWTLRGRRGETPPEVHALGTFAVVYLGGVSLLGAYPRFFYIVVPILVWWTAVVLGTAKTAAAPPADQAGPLEPGSHPAPG